MVGTKTTISLSIETRQGLNPLGQLAGALAAGGEALSRFRDSASENEEGKDLVNPTVPILVVLLIKSLTISRATAQRLRAEKKLVVASFSSSTNCKLSCR